MSIINLLIKDKHIAGVEINNSFVRVAYLKPIKKNNKKTVGNKLILLEEQIPDGTIVNGALVNKEVLQKVLIKLWRKRALRRLYAIVSIPEDNIYSKIFPFPKNITETQLEEAIKLTMDFQIPINKADAYVDWENACDSNIINEILISAVLKKEVDVYLNVINSAKIKLVALESHIGSITRSIKTKFGEATLVVKENSNGFTIFVVKDGSLRFSRTIASSAIKDIEFLKKEINNIKTWYEYEKKCTVVELIFTDALIKEEYLQYEELKNIPEQEQYKWLISMGTAIRGALPKGADKQISLLPTRTEDAYAYQKKAAFVLLIRNMTIAISIFFLVTFLSIYIFVLALSQIAIKNNPNVNANTELQEIFTKETLIQKVNSITETSKSILLTTPKWSLFLEELNSKIIDGIIISNLSVISPLERISIVGIAKDRETLNNFKTSLEQSLYIATVDLPITNLEQKGDIPFSMSFSLKDPTMLYNK